MEESAESQLTVQTPSIADISDNSPAARKTTRSSNDISMYWRPAVKVNREAGARSSVILGWPSDSQEPSTHENLRHLDANEHTESLNGAVASHTIRVLREPGGGGQDAYACLYENTENDSERSGLVGIQAKSIICDGSSTSLVDSNGIDTDDIAMSNAMNSTYSEVSSDVEMKEPAQDKAAEAMILTPASPISVEATDPFASIFGFAMDTRGFFSPSVMEEDRELLSRVIAQVSCPGRVLTAIADANLADIGTSLCA